MLLYHLGSLGIAGAAFPAEKIVQSQWATAPIRIDGANQDWQDAPLLTDKGSKAEYALRNDGEFLYILFVFKSLPALSTYEVSGMKVYYDLPGQKSKSTGFHFVKKSMTADQLIANIEKGGEVLTEEKKAEVRKQKGYMTYEGVPLDPKKAAGQQPGVEVEPATFRDRLSPQVSVVEFRIPLARLVEAGAAAVPGESIKLGFEWGGMTSEMRSAYMARHGRFRLPGPGHRRRRPRLPSWDRATRAAEKAAAAAPWAGGPIPGRGSTPSGSMSSWLTRAAERHRPHAGTLTSKILRTRPEEPALPSMMTST